MFEGPVAATGQEDELVSKSHQVSYRDLAEADEAMKRLGLFRQGQCPSVIRIWGLEFFVIFNLKRIDLFSNFNCRNLTNY